MKMLKFVNQLDRHSFKPLYVQLSEIILNYANDNQLEHGATLPSENALLSQFDVSRNTIRLAVERLVKMGVARKTRGQGTFYIKDNKSLPVHYHHAFEGSARLIGLKITNKLIDIQNVSGQVAGSKDWAIPTGTKPFGSDEKN